MESHLQLQGWSRSRRVIVLRRKLRERPATPEPDSGQLRLPGWALEYKGGDWYEHAVLVTSWEEKELLAVAQAYRDRADTENMFDELKNQWGWTGFSTQDLKRSQLMARMVALIFNWWSLFTRIASGEKHGEAITTRPLFLQGIARHTRHAQQNHLSLSSLHAKARKIANLLASMSAWLRAFRDSAEQLASKPAGPLCCATSFAISAPAPRPIRCLWSRPTAESRVTGLDDKAALDEEILRLGKEIDAEYAQYEGLLPGTMSAEANEQLQKRIRPIQARIEKLRIESQAILVSMRSMEHEARVVVARCARVAPKLTPLLDQFWEVYGSRYAPDVELLKLRKLLTQVRQRLEAALRTQMLSPSENTPQEEEVRAGISDKRGTRPKLELHRERIELWDRLSSELAHIWQDTRKYATVRGLKEKHPDFEIWKRLSDSEQQEVLNGEFSPKAYAGNLVLRIYSLRSIETLRKSRKLVPQSSESAAVNSQGCTNSYPLNRTG